MNYNDFVASITKPGQDILMSLDPRKANLMHMAMLLSGEAGELLDCIKKHVIYDKKLDYDNLIEEMGDIEFALQALRNHFAVDRGTIIDRNIQKLKERFPLGTYSDMQAQQRADKTLA